MITKLKKILKKTLVKIHIENKNSYFLLENKLRTDKENQNFSSSTFLIGSNIIQLNKNYCANSLGLKLPVTLKVSQTFENLISNLTKSRSKLGFSALVLVKKDNLILKNQNYNFFVKTKEQKMCMNIISLKNFALSLIKYYGK